MESTELAGVITGAYSVMGSAMQIASTIVEEPLATICHAYWTRAQDENAEGAVIKQIQDHEMFSDSNGSIYWADPARVHAVNDPLPGNEHLPEWDMWLQLNGSIMQRVAVEPISINMERPLWNATAGAVLQLQELDAALTERFIDIVAALREAGTPDQTIVVVQPRASLSDSAIPFECSLHISCRCGLVRQEHTEGGIILTT